jgi:hypothetical protein
MLINNSQIITSMQNRDKKKLIAIFLTTITIAIFIVPFTHQSFQYKNKVASVTHTTTFGLIRTELKMVGNGGTFYINEYRNIEVGETIEFTYYRINNNENQIISYTLWG